MILFGFSSTWLFPNNSHPDEVKELPGLNFPLNYKHYSGYLNATKGRYLHYWFVESQRSPSIDPVILWLSGGPGCSSLGALLNELGPFRMSADGKSLHNNSYSWNRVANLLFLEAPAGVGFSYADNGNYSTDDDSVSKDNYVALQNFFEKFPEFNKNDFYIAGQSYAGIYIPTLSVRVLTGGAKINFKGFAIGNGFLDDRLLPNNLVFFAYYHGLLGPELWQSLAQKCCVGHASLETCNFVGNVSQDCKNAVHGVNYIVYGSGVNVYNLYSDCAGSKDNLKYLVDIQNGILKLPEALKNSTSIQLPCVDSSNLIKYLNQPAVRQALHIPLHVQDWGICSVGVLFGYKRIYNNMRPQILQLIGSGKLRGLIYNGDVDIACNFLGDELFAHNLGLQVTKERTPWKFNKQIAGFAKSYDKLTFLTVKGAGHMVPHDKPGAAFKMIDSFLSNKPYD
ncbi:lysosomal protective protein [Caerostris darwini]|uniref:Lysosomal protective protein n=1 Tax=Caerostris darwini TaxID=1538125 RepID=A0AAV4WSP6_9ARAC|nr:lysosomal protective protein [Caerostris darwini]